MGQHTVEEHRHSHDQYREDAVRPVRELFNYLVQRLGSRADEYLSPHGLSRIDIMHGRYDPSEEYLIHEIFDQAVADGVLQEAHS